MTTLEDLKKRATASEAVLIERVEALVRESCDADALKAATKQEIKAELRRITDQVHQNCGRDPVHLVMTDTFRTIEDYLKS